MADPFLYDLVVNGGPVAFATAVLWIRQTRLMRAIITLASAHENVDEDAIQERIRII